MRQYGERLSRWTINPLAALAAMPRQIRRRQAAIKPAAAKRPLIAGCGTGEHPFDIAQKSPQARILAVDLSLASLAYARRKTRDED